jgi:hypothetical protein
MSAYVLLKGTLLNHGHYKSELAQEALVQILEHSRYE